MLHTLLVRAVACATLAAFAFSAIGVPREFLGAPGAGCRCAVDARAAGKCCCSRSGQACCSAPPAAETTRSCCANKQKRTRSKARVTRETLDGAGICSRDVPAGERILARADEAPSSHAQPACNDHRHCGRPAPADFGFTDNCRCGADSLAGLLMNGEPRVLSAASLLPAPHAPRDLCQGVPLPFGVEAPTPATPPPILG